jgi:hypothetical protein
MFRSTKVGLCGLDDLAAALDGLDRNSCVLLGRLIDGVDPNYHRRTSLQKVGRAPPSYTAATHEFLAIDLDDNTAGLDWLHQMNEKELPAAVLELIPPELHGVRCHWRATASTGLKPGVHLRLFYWLDRKLSLDEMKTWLAGCKGIDGSIYKVAQPIYTHAPDLDDGVEDPVLKHGLQRSGMVAGFRKRVAVPEITVPVREHKEAPDGLTEDDADPVLTSAAKAVCERIGKGSGATGEHAKDLIGVLAGMHTQAGKTLSIAGLVDHAMRHCGDWIQDRVAFEEMAERLLDDAGFGGHLVGEDGRERISESVEVPTGDLEDHTDDDSEPKTARGKVRLMSYSEVMARPAPMMVVEELVPACKLVMPWGGTGEGKTYFTIELATAIAMRRAAFGRLKVQLPGDSGVVVMFLGEDHDEAVKGRITAVAKHYGRSVEGLVFTTDLALPLDNDAVFKECVEEIRRIQRETGKPIDAIIDDTLGRTLGSLPPNDGETGDKFTRYMEELIREFRCPVIVNAHEPKAGGTISGTQRFLDNCPVTPHIKGHKDGDLQLTGFTVRFEPKYRIGRTPKPFSVEAQTVELPAPVNGSHTDLVFTTTSRPAERDEYRGQVVEAIAHLLKQEGGEYTNVPAVCRHLNPIEEGESEEDYKKRVDTACRKLRRAIMGSQNNDGAPKGALKELVMLTKQGTTFSEHRLYLPDGVLA